MENGNVVNSNLDKVSNSDGENFKVIIINRYPPLTSVYRWSYDLSSIFKKIRTDKSDIQYFRLE